jgi:DNA-binding NtrC family response regulator
MMKQAVLIVDDMRDMLKFLGRLLGNSIPVDIHTAIDAQCALDMVAQKDISVVLADIRMQKINGLKLLEKIKQRDKTIIVIMMTAYGSIENAVESLKLGAYDYITKPFQEEKLIHMVTNALAHHALILRNTDLEKRIRSKDSLEAFIGHSAPIQRLTETIQCVAKTDATILITGETGTGKDLAAKMVHTLSRRADKPFVAVNCPAIPENILESELFGFRKGAFTGATHDKEGLFETADGGTLLFDEIGDISPMLQAKLLRVLQEKEIKPLGDNQSRKVDVRFIAATNQDLEKKMAAGQFRDDLYYRLNVVSIRTPSLRDIPEDIPFLANHFLSSMCAELGMAPRRLSDNALRFLAAKRWSGNVRQLQNVVKRAIIFSKEVMIEPADFDFESGASGVIDRDCPPFFDSTYKEAKKNMLEDFDVRYISHMLNSWKGNVTAAAKKAGLERQSLQYLMRKYDINANRFRTDAD